MGGVIRLDYGAMIDVAKTSEIEITPVALAKIRAQENMVVERQAEEAEKRKRTRGVQGQVSWSGLTWRRWRGRLLYRSGFVSKGR